MDPRNEESAGVMEHRAQLAAMKDAPMDPLKKNAGVMEQRVQLTVMNDAPTTYGEEESA